MRMRRIVLRIAPFLAAITALSACGGKTPEAKDPADEENASSGDGDKPLTDKEKAAHRAEKSESAPESKGDGDEKKSPCGGAQISDLLAVLSQSSCIVPNAAPDAKGADVGEMLEVKVSPDKPRIAPGGNAKITVVFRNKGKADLPLDFVVDPEPHFDFELYTAKGARADKPAGAEPALPQGAAAEADKQTARITLPPQGTARLTLSWDAVKYKWASKDKARGAVAGRGYPRDPAGPLARGKYVLRVITPLVGIVDGIDHDLSQPRTPIVVGGS